MNGKEKYLIHGRFGLNDTIQLDGYNRSTRSISEGTKKKASGSPGKFAGKGRCGGGDSVVDEEVILTIPWAWHDDNAVWCGKASTMEVWTASNASGKDGEECVESRRLQRAIVELVPGELAAEKMNRKLQEVRKDTEVTKDIITGIGEGSPSRKLGCGGDVARASVGARPTSME